MVKQQWIWSPPPSLAGVRMKDGQLLWFSQDGKVPGGRVLQSPAEFVADGPVHPDTPEDVLEKLQTIVAELTGRRHQPGLPVEGSEFAAWFTASTPWPQVQDVIEAGLDLEPDDEAWWPLGLAVRLGNDDVVAGLLELGVDLDAEHRTFGDGHLTTLLHMALKHPRLLEPLLNAGADIHSPDWADRTALDVAVEDGRPPATLRRLVAAGADVNRCPGPDFIDEPGPPAWVLVWQALHRRGADIDESLGILLEAGADREQRGFDGTTLAELLRRRSLL